MNAEIRTALVGMGLNPSLLDNPAHRSIDVRNIGRWRADHDADRLNLYVGRWHMSKLPMGLQKLEGLGNPHPLAPFRCSICDCLHDRGTTIDLFKADLGNSRHLRIAAWKLAAVILADTRSVTLWCHCAPLACHADVLATRICSHFNWFTRI